MCNLLWVSVAAACLIACCGREYSPGAQEETIEIGTPALDGECSSVAGRYLVTTSELSSTCAGNVSKISKEETIGSVKCGEYERSWFSRDPKTDCVATFDTVNSVNETGLYTATSYHLVCEDHECFGETETSYELVE